MTKKSKQYKWQVMNEIKQYKMNNPIKSKELQVKFGLRGVHIREIVHFLRTEEHLPICSDSSGYFYARNKYEAQHTIAQLRSRIRQINEAVLGIEKAEYEPEQDNQQTFGFQIKRNYEYPD